MTPLKNRRSIRLKGYDYTRPGLYFITICTQNRVNSFGTIKDNRIELNEAGSMIEMTWNEIPEYYTGFDIHEFVVMPNHIHGIIEIIDCDIAETMSGAARRQPENERVDDGMMAITGWVITDDTGTGQTRGPGQTRGSAPTVMVSSDVPGQSIINGSNHVGATPRGCPVGPPVALLHPHADSQTRIPICIPWNRSTVRICTICRMGKPDTDMKPGRHGGLPLP
jgi:hypothetical protein